MENNLSIRIPTVTIQLDIEHDNKKKIAVANPNIYKDPTLKPYTPKLITPKKSYCFNFLNLFRAVRILNADF